MEFLEMCRNYVSSIIFFYFILLLTGNNYYFYMTILFILQFHIFPIFAVQVNLHNYRGKHLLLFTKGWTLTNLIGQFLPGMRITK